MTYNRKYNAPSKVGIFATSSDLFEHTNDSHTKPPYAWHQPTPIEQYLLFILYKEFVSAYILPSHNPRSLSETWFFQFKTDHGDVIVSFQGFYNHTENNMDLVIGFELNGKSFPPPGTIPHPRFDESDIGSHFSALELFKDKEYKDVMTTKLLFGFSSPNESYLPSSIFGEIDDETQNIVMRWGC